MHVVGTSLDNFHATASGRRAPNSPGVARPPVSRGEAQDVGVGGDDQDVAVIGQSQRGRRRLAGCLAHGVDDGRGGAVTARHDDQHVDSGAASQRLPRIDGLIGVEPVLQQRGDV